MLQWMEWSRLRPSKLVRDSSLLSNISRQSFYTLHGIAFLSTVIKQSNARILITTFHTIISILTSSTVTEGSLEKRLWGGLGEFSSCNLLSIAFSNGPSVS